MRAQKLLKRRDLPQLTLTSKSIRKLTPVLLLTTSLFLGWGENLKAQQPAQQAHNSGDEEYNFTWLDPDKKVFVLQNRKYRKAGRFAAFLSGGLNLSNAYRTEYLVAPRAAYWLTEQFGAEVVYAKISNGDNGTLTALKAASATALPYVRDHTSYVAGLLTWTPWYAKINFFNNILYFDWFLNAGLGQLSTRVDTNTRDAAKARFVDETKVAFFLGTGHNYYLTQNFSVRLDLIGIFYSASAADTITSRSVKSFDFTAGVGYTF